MCLVNIFCATGNVLTSKEGWTLDMSAPFWLIVMKHKPMSDHRKIILCLLNILSHIFTGTDRPTLFSLQKMFIFTKKLHCYVLIFQVFYVQYYSYYLDNNVSVYNDKVFIWLAPPNAYFLYSFQKSLWNLSWNCRFTETSRLVHSCEVVLYAYRLTKSPPKLFLVCECNAVLQWTLVY